MNYENIIDEIIGGRDGLSKLHTSIYNCKATIYKGMPCLEVQFKSKYVVGKSSKNYRADTIRITQLSNTYTLQIIKRVTRSPDILKQGRERILQELPNINKEELINKINEIALLTYDN